MIKNNNNKQQNKKEKEKETDIVYNYIYQSHEISNDQYKPQIKQMTKHLVAFRGLLIRSKILSKHTYKKENPIDMFNCSCIGFTIRNKNNQSAILCNYKPFNSINIKTNKIQIYNKWDNVIFFKKPGKIELYITACMNTILNNFNTLHGSVIFITPFNWTQSLYKTNNYSEYIVDIMYHLSGCRIKIKVTCGTSYTKHKLAKHMNVDILNSSDISITTNDMLL